MVEVGHALRASGVTRRGGPAVSDGPVIALEHKRKPLGDGVPQASVVWVLPQGPYRPSSDEPTPIASLSQPLLAQS